ncbi:MAG TPA: hypothetical protein VIB48_01475 [Acidimicrobiia bacterium]|jgi:hypothetical protein
MADGTGTEPRRDTEVETLQAELDAERKHAADLEARNAALQGRDPAKNGSDGTKRARRGHRWLVALLLVLGFILTPITIVVLFAHTELTDTGRYVSTIKPLASDPAVQAYAADQITTNLFDQVDVNAYVKDALPDRAQALAGPLTSALRSFTHEAALRLLESKEFQTLWVEANRAAHSQINDILSGRKGGGAISANTNGAITLDLSKLAQRVKQRLEDTGIGVFSKIPADKVSGKITIFQARNLYKARRGLQALNRLAFVLPFLVFACFGGAIFLSRNRRRGFIKAAVVFTLGAALLAVVLAITRGLYLDSAVNNGIPHDAAASVYDNLIRLLQTSMRSILAFSIVVVVVAVLAGPSRLAVWFRAEMRAAASWLGRQSDAAGWSALGPSGFVVAHKAGMRIAVAVIGFAVLFLWNRPTPMVVVWLGVLALLALALIEFFGRERSAPAVGTAPPAVSAPA